MRLNSYRRVRIPNLSVRVLSDVLIGAGLDHLVALRRAGIDVESAERPGGVVTGEQELAFQRIFVELTAGRTDLWIKAGHGFSLAALGAHGLAMATSPTLVDFVDVCQSSDLTYALAEVSPVRAPAGALIGVRMVHDPGLIDIIPFSVHRDVTAMIRSLTMITMKDPPPLTEVHLPIGAISPEFERLVAAPVRLNAPDVQLRWDPSRSVDPLPFGNAFQHNTYIHQAKENLHQFRLEQDFVTTVVDTTKDTAGVGASVGEVASRLNTSVRTLQRKLEQEGVTFREIRDRARFELASSMLLDTNRSILSIASRLGYHEPNSFAAAFKRWCGVSPSQYRSAPRRSGQTHHEGT